MLRLHQLRGRKIFLLAFWARFGGGVGVHRSRAGELAVAVREGHWGYGLAGLVLEHDSILEDGLVFDHGTSMRREVEMIGKLGRTGSGE